MNVIETGERTRVHITYRALLEQAIQLQLILIAGVLGQSLGLVSRKLEVVLDPHGCAEKQPTSKALQRPFDDSPQSSIRKQRSMA